MHPQARLPMAALILPLCLHSGTALAEGAELEAAITVTVAGAVTIRQDEKGNVHAYDSETRAPIRPQVSCDKTACTYAVIY